MSKADHSLPDPVESNKAQLKIWSMELTVMHLQLTKIMAEMQAHGRGFLKGEPLAIARESLKSEIQSIQTMIDGPKILKANLDDIKPN